MQEIFPGINLSTAHQRIPVMESNRNEPGKSDASVINLAESEQASAPMAITGLDVSIASTSNNGGNATDFSRLSQQTGATSQPQMFATTQWKPKEPSCFYGCSSEDVHTWTSLVRHYLTFMGGSDAQQVAYSVTLLHKHAHEWYMGYEKRIRHPPRDWASLATTLLERLVPISGHRRPKAS